jgi:hypothetical protein
MAAAFALLSLSLPVFPQETPTTRSALAEIVEARDRCAEYAGIAKQELKADRLVKARSLYIEAYSSNSAWVATVKSAIREGTAKRLDTDKLYERVSSKAAAASKEFAEYVKTETTPSPGAKSGTMGYGAPISPVLILASPLADIGIKLWKAYREKVTAERTAASEGFAKDAAWKSWEEAGAKSSPGKPDADSALPTVQLPRSTR